MNAVTGWRRWGTPLNVAAYATMLAVGIALWQRAPQVPAAVAVEPRIYALAMLVLFLVGFLIVTGRANNRQWPVYGGLALMLTATLLLVPGDRTSTAVALLVIVASVVTTVLPAVWTVMVLLAANAAVFVILAQRLSVGDTLLIAAIYGGFQAFAAFASHAFRRANEAAIMLRETNAQLLATRSLLAESARDGERLRLSRELHDVSGHKLTALTLNLQLLAQDLALAGRREFQTARQLTQQLLDDLRGVVSQLRRHDGIDLRQALQQLAEVIPSPRVIVDADADARIDDAERAESLLRLAQESLTNAVKHSGAREVRIHLKRDGERLLLSIEDDGRAPKNLRAGHGIEGMRERAQELGATLTFSTAVGGGLRIAVAVPRERPL